MPHIKMSAVKMTPFDWLVSMIPLEGATVSEIQRHTDLIHVCPLRGEKNTQSHLW